MADCSVPLPREDRVLLARLSSGPAQSEVADQDSGILSKELGTDPARLLSVSVGKNPDKLMGCNGQDPGRFALWWDLKFSLAPPPAADRRIIRKRNFGRRGGGFQAAVFLPSSLWLEKRRPGGHRHDYSDNRFENALSNYKAMGYAVPLSKTENQVSVSSPPALLPRGWQ